MTYILLIRTLSLLYHTILRFYSICWCQADGYRNRDLHHPVDSCGLGYTLPSFYTRL